MCSHYVSIYAVDISRVLPSNGSGLEEIKKSDICAIAWAVEGAVNVKRKAEWREGQREEAAKQTDTAYTSNTWGVKLKHRASFVRYTSIRWDGCRV